MARDGLVPPLICTRGLCIYLLGAHKHLALVCKRAVCHRYNIRGVVSDLLGGQLRNISDLTRHHQTRSVSARTTSRLPWRIRHGMRLLPRLPKRDDHLPHGGDDSTVGSSHSRGRTPIITV